MKTNYTLLGGLLLTAALGMGLAMAAPVDSSWLRVAFTGDSTLHGFSGIVHRGNAEKINAANGHDRVRITIPVLSLDTDHQARDKRMYKMFEEEAFHVITGEADLEAVLNRRQADVPLTMTIHGVTHDITAHRRADADGRVELEYDLSLTSFNLTPPSVLGMIRVSDNVHVAVSIDRGALENLNNQSSIEKEMH